MISVVVALFIISQVSQFKLLECISHRKLLVTHLKCNCINYLNSALYLHNSKVAKPENITEERTNDFVEYDRDSAELELQAIFSRYKNIDYEDIPDDTRELIVKLIKLAGPSELEKRLQILGFTPITYAGFALAAVLISLNSILGAGWLGDKFGMNERIDLVPLSNNQDQSLQFDYEKYQKESNTLINAENIK